MTTLAYPWTTGAWSAVGARTVLDLLVGAAARCPGKAVLVFEDGAELTRRDLCALVEGFAAELADVVSPGDRVAIVMDNRAEFMVAFLATVAVRGAVVPVNPDSGPADAAHVLRGSGAVAAVVDEQGAALVEAVGELPALRRTFAVRGEEPGGLPAGEGGLDLAALASAAEPADVLAVTYTSGTTGLPKGCMIDHVWALRAADVALRVHAYGPDDRIFYPVKFFYMDGFNALVRALACDGAYVAARKFSVSRFWDVVRAQDVTIVSSIASMPVWLLKAEPGARDRDHRVRFAIQAHIPAELHAALDERWGFPWLENYGMMEAGVIARVPVELADELRGTGSAGPPAPEVELRVVDDAFEDVASGDVGEIVVRQPGMFRGYLGMPEATAELVHDGWIRTGDLGVLDARGYVSIVGRKKDVIRRSGENVSAAEVEGQLTAHPGVLAVAVVGVPDLDRGEELKAFVQPVAGADLDPAELVAFCAGRLAPHKVPRYVELVDEFPLTPSMRIRKELLRRRGDAAATAWDRESGTWGADAR